jgi:hypothetical protein
MNEMKCRVWCKYFSPVDYILHTSVAHKYTVEALAVNVVLNISKTLPNARSLNLN